MAEPPLPGGAAVPEEWLQQAMAAGLPASEPDLRGRLTAAAQARAAARQAEARRGGAGERPSTTSRRRVRGFTRPEYIACVLGAADLVMLQNVLIESIRHKASGYMILYASSAIACVIGGLLASSLRASRHQQWEGTACLLQAIAGIVLLPSGLFGGLLCSRGNPWCPKCDLVLFTRASCLTLAIGATFVYAGLIAPPAPASIPKEAPPKPKTTTSAEPQG